MPMRHSPVRWSRGALKHAWNKHGVDAEEIGGALEDPHRLLLRRRGRDYILVGMGTSRLVTQILKDHGDHYMGATAWPSTEREKRKYRKAQNP